jgi:phosphatidylinositol glycan class B
MCDRVNHSLFRPIRPLAHRAPRTAACTFIFLLDSWYFGTGTFTPLNFLRTNLSSVSTFYGRSPWHYYLFQAIPILCNVTVVFVLHGIWQGIQSGSSPVRRLVALVFWTVGIYSLAAHKEWRFIHPLLPAMHVLASKPLVDDYTEKSNPSLWLPSRIGKRWRIPIFLTLLSTPYLLFVQSRSQIAVMHHIRSIPVAELRSVGFLMPCHSTPWQSHLHRPHLTSHSLWAIGCEPPLE